MGKDGFLTPKRARVPELQNDLTNDSMWIAEYAIYQRLAINSREDTRAHSDSTAAPKKMLDSAA